jgi:spore coat polysaccharide biosynthesis predicted glycosyltransferase SpsG
LLYQHPQPFCSNSHLVHDVHTKGWRYLIGPQNYQQSQQRSKATKLRIITALGSAEGVNTSGGVLADLKQHEINVKLRLGWVMAVC